MAIYLRDNLDELLHGKYILLLGDSVQRSVYKDLIVLSHGNRFISQSELRKKGEDMFLDDKLVYRSELMNGIGYREVREYKRRGFHFRYHFITRVYNEYVESILDELEIGEQPMPDVLVLNSCLWDISRYGRDSIESYKDNLVKLCKRLKEMLSTDTLIIWRTTLPVSEEMKGGFLTADAEWCRNTLRLDVLRANYFAYNIIQRYNYDIIDMHYHFRFQLHRQARDGVHWNSYAHRRMTNILLSHISVAWNKQIPNLPWEDDSKIDFAEDEVAMNTTEVLKQAYEPQNVRKQFPPWKGSPWKDFRNIPHRQLYTSFYDIPEEEEETNVDENCNYQILSQEPTFSRKESLPTNPYPDSNKIFVSGVMKRMPLLQMDLVQHEVRSGKIRCERKVLRKHLYRRPGKTSEMLKMRLNRDRASDRQSVFDSQPKHLQSKYGAEESMAASLKRQPKYPQSRYRKDYGTSRQVSWSNFSRYNPCYSYQ